MEKKQYKKTNRQDSNFLYKDVFITYFVCIFLGFIGTLIYYILMHHFAYLVGWIFPSFFVGFGFYLQQKGADFLLKKARDYGEYAKKPKGFMFYSSFLYILTYLLYIIPFIVEGCVSLKNNLSLTNTSGWFNIYFSLGSTFLLPILLFMVKLTKYFINKKSSEHY